jgi:hypothetical protein
MKGVTSDAKGNRESRKKDGVVNGVKGSREVE